MFIYFQINRDQKTYKIQLEPSDVWSVDEVLINGQRYRVLGDSESVSWLRKKIPQFSSHYNISIEALKAKLVDVGAKNIKAVEKTHILGTKLLTKKNIEKLSAEETKLQEAIHRCQRHIDRLELLLKSKGAKRYKASRSQQVIFYRERLSLLKKDLKNLRNTLVDFYHHHLEEKTNERLKMQAQNAQADTIMKAKSVEMDAYLQYMQAKKQFQGAVLIQDHGEPILRSAYGSRNVKGAPNTPDTRFCIGSMTKQFTGAAIALLMQKRSLIVDSTMREKLSLKIPINDLLPKKYQDQKWNEICLEHLLRHTSGLPCYGSFPEDERRKKNFTLDELISLVKRHKLLFDPGEMHSYSNDGYVLLGAIIENLSGQSLERFLHDQIFVPCHMNHTGMISSYDEESVATGFDRSQIVPTERHLSKTYAAGGIISTVDDLGRWDRALYEIVPFTELTKKQMFTCPTAMKIYNPHDPHLRYAYDRKTKRHHLLPDQQYPETRYGFGIGLAKWAAIGHGREGDILCHDGSLPGFSSYMARYIPSQRSIIVLCNNDDIATKEEVQRHLEAILFS